MLQNELVIINTSSPLRNYMKRRPTHYAEILSRNNRVINVSSAPMKDYSKFKTKCEWKEKIFFRLPGTRFVIIQKLNKWLYKMFLNKLINSLPQKPILWHFFSGNYEIVKSLPNKISVLEICDDTPEFFSDDPQKYKEVKENEDKMIKSVDVVFTISDYLKQKKVSMRPDIQVIKNGVVYEDFAETPELPKNKADELYSYKTPIVGYCGAVSKWFDFDLIKGIANKLKNVNFVFIGRISPEQIPITEKLNNNANIHFIGERPYKELPHYLKYFELTHIPFVLNELIASVNPIKLYEYLASGRRVISTPLPEVMFYKKEGIIEIADGIEAYSKAIEKMLTANAETYIADCQDIAKENTWQSRVEMASKIIEEKMNIHI